MVCLGNICRSPLAEGILKSKLPNSDFIIESSGTGSWHIGNSPDQRSIDIAAKNNIDISYQRGRHFEVSDFDDFDFIYAMDFSVYKAILKMAPNQTAEKKVSLILNELFPGENIDVPDPYYGNENGFETVFNMLDSACEVIATRLNKK